MFFVDPIVCGIVVGVSVWSLFYYADTLLSVISSFHISDEERAGSFTLIVFL